MYDGPTVVLLTLGVIKTLKHVLDTLKDSLSDDEPAVRYTATECVGGGREALLNVALIRLTAWRDLWWPCENEQDGDGHRSEELLSLLWGSGALGEVKRLLTMIKDDVLIVEALVVKDIQQQHSRKGIIPLSGKKVPRKADQQTRSYQRAAEVQERISGLCDRIQTLETLAQFAFRSPSGPVASVDHASDDLRDCYQRVSSKRREVRPFIDFCNKSELSLNLRLSNCELAAKSPWGPWLQLQDVLLVFEGNRSAGSRRPACFVVSQAKTPHIAVDHYRQDSVDNGDEARLVKLMQGNPQRLTHSCSAAQIQVQHNEQGFVVKECQHTVAAMHQEHKHRHDRVSRAQIPLVEETIRLATSEKIEVACSLAYHALILLGSTWASCFNAWNLRRQESADISWWKLHVHNDLVDIPSLRQPAEAILRLQIAEFGRLLLSLAVGSGSIKASDGAMELARDVLPRVERRMGVKYSSACLFCLNATAPLGPSCIADGADASADMLKSFFQEVCLPLQRLQECLQQS